MAPPRLFILDAHSLIYQVFHAIARMNGPDGMPTNAVFGFVRDILTIRARKPEYFVCAFDSPGDTFRHELYPEYKANRSAMPDDLRPQIGVIKEILQAFRIPILAEPGMEADDFLASIAAESSRRKIHAFLCTADKDVRQCITPYASIFDLRRNRLLDRDFLLSDWGITPEQVVDYQAMVGDSTDNIPGVPGIGPKTATQLLQKYPTLEAIYEHIDEIPQKGTREKLLKGRTSAWSSRELVRLKTDIELPEDWTSYQIHEPDIKSLLEIFARCGFHRFADEVRAMAPAEVIPPAEWNVDYQLINTPERFETFFAELSEQKRISFDLETTSVHPTQADIIGYAISWKPEVAYYVAVRGPAGEVVLDPDHVLERMRPLIENPQIEKVGQNLKYDIIVLRRVGVELAGLAFDTMVASYLLEPGERIHGLDDLAQRYLNHKNISISELIGKGKSQVGMETVPLAKVAPYAGEDADVALRLTDLLAPMLEAKELTELYQTLELPLIEVLALMEFHGIRIDAQRLRSLSREYAVRLEALVAQAHELAGHEFNVDSPKQLQKILYEELSLPILKRTKTGPSTDEEVLDQLALHHELPERILEYRKIAKLKGTYLDALATLADPKTSRIHASFNQTVAATGRLSSSDPNLQNIPVRTDEGRQLRAAFLSEPGKLLISADYSQIELRFLAHFSNDATLRQAFDDDLDIHAVVAAQIEGVALEDVNSAMRGRAKAVNFGIMYGLSPFGLARQLGIPQSEASAFIDAYFDQYPGIEAFITEVLEGARKEGYVRTILGRKRPISGIRRTTGRNRNTPEREAVNTVVQGSAADLIKKAMLDIHRRLADEPELDAQMLLQIHDELVFEVREDQVEAVGRLVTELMTEAIPLSVPLKVNVGVGENWLEMEPLEVGLVR